MIHDLILNHDYLNQVNPAYIYVYIYMICPKSVPILSLLELSYSFHTIMHYLYTYHLLYIFMYPNPTNMVRGRFYAERKINGKLFNIL